MAEEEVRNPRLIVPGDRIVPKGLRTPEVVRSVSVVVHMANGMDYVYEADEDVRMAPEGVLAPSEEEILAAHERAIEAIRADAEAIEARTAEIEKETKKLHDAHERERKANSERIAAVKGE